MPAYFLKSQQFLSFCRSFLLCQKQPLHSAPSFLSLCQQSHTFWTLHWMTALGSWDIYGGEEHSLGTLFRNILSEHSLGTFIRNSENISYDLILSETHDKFHCRTFLDLYFFFWLSWKFLKSQFLVFNDFFPYVISSNYINNILVICALIFEGHFKFSVAVLKHIICFHYTLYHSSSDSSSIILFYS